MSRASASGASVATIIVDPSGGMSGDMFLAGLFALGANVKEVQADVARLPGLEPFRIVVGHVKREGIAAWRARVLCEGDPCERGLAGILDMIGSSHLDERVKELASGMFRLLGEAEGRIHGISPGSVHFHEVGAVDSIVDIVGAAVALSKLGFPAIYHRPVRLGTGSVRVSHGKLPLPAPATLELLKGRTLRLSDEEGEIVTPTAAAILRALASELPPGLAIRPSKVVYSAGTRARGAAPGVLRLLSAEICRFDKEISVIRTTIDDMNPEIYTYVQERLFDVGALEVYLAQLIMKKGRPGVLLTVLCETDIEGLVMETIFRETTTLGLRVCREGRIELERWSEGVETRFGKVRVKRRRLPGGALEASPEYESCREVARASGVPINEVYEAALLSIDSARPRRGGSPAGKGGGRKKCSKPGSRRSVRGGKQR